MTLGDDLQHAWDLVEKTRAKYDEARAERDRADADAARYRWLRENCREYWSGEDAKVEPVQLIHYEPGLEGTEGWRERLDAAIDAHLRGEGKQ